MKTKYIAMAMAVMLAGLTFASCTKDVDDEVPQPSRWVDLGLPSGLLWARCNVGASTPEGYGDYYAWGETTTKSNYNWNTYRYSNNEGLLDKYCSRPLYGRFHFTDTLTILEPDDDAATALISNWARIPTKSEWQELIDNTTAEWTSLNGVKGRLFTAPNGNSLFLPAAGMHQDRELDSDGVDGNYWSSSLETSYPIDAWRLDFSSEFLGINSARRYNGFSIRAVRNAQ